MSLARRLILALIALTLIMLAAGGAVVVIQRHYLVQQLDTRLSQLAENPVVPLLLSQRSRQVSRFPAAFGDIYLGMGFAMSTAHSPPFRRPLTTRAWCRIYKACSHFPCRQVARRRRGSRRICG